MSLPNSILITGSTGALGGHLLVRFLKNGYRCRLLVRTTSGQSAVERIHRQFKRLGLSAETIQRWKHLWEVVEGDLTLERFGLDEQRYRELYRDLDGLVHAAAFVEFQCKDPNRFHAINVTGTRNVLALCDHHRVPWMHVSTAYVQLDDKEPTTDFLGAGRNDYETSKRLAERMVLSTRGSDSHDTCIVRPSILFGAFQDGRSLCFKNLYQFLRLMEIFHRDNKARRSHIPLKLALNPEATLNLLPVDTAADIIFNLYQKQHWPHAIYPVAHPQPLRLEEVARFLSRIFDIPIQFTSPKTGSNHGESRLERAAREVLRPFQDYVYGEPRFNLSAIRDILPDYMDRIPTLNLEYFQRCLDFARSVQWGSAWEAADPLEPIDSRTMEFVHSYFDLFLRGKVGCRLLEHIEHLNVRFGIHLNEMPAFHRPIVIENGFLKSVGRSEQPNEVVYRLSSMTFRKIVAGRYSPQQAFFDRAIEIEGDPELALNTAVALSEFFVRHPYTESVAHEDCAAIHA